MALLALLFGLPAPAQQWTQEELEARIGDFLTPGTLARLGQIGKLVSAQKDACAAIAAKIHGNHREYLLLVERLVTQLTDERWPQREDAERRLVEVGGKAQTLIEKHRDTGELLEERLRCARVLRSLAQQGTDKAEREIAILRGLVETAPYLEPDDSLRQALVSALGHTDPLIVEGAVRALAYLGGDDEATGLNSRLETAQGSLRACIIESLARMRSSRALAFCDQALQKGDLDINERLALVRALRLRSDAADVLQRLQTGSDALVAAFAALQMPKDDGAPLLAILRLTTSERIEGQPFLGLDGNSIEIGSPVEGLERVHFPLRRCDALTFDDTKPVIEAGFCRVFLTQGSMLTGKQLRIDGDQIVLESAVFGRVSIPRNALQGIAIDPALDRLIGASTKIDRVRLQDGTFVDGKITATDDQQVVLTTADGGQRQLALTDVAGMLFTRPLQTTTDDTVYARVDLRRGDRIYGHIAELTRGHIGIVSPLLGSAAIPLTGVAQIEFGLHGGALWGFTLVADYSDNRVIEVDDKGQEIFVMEEVFGAWDAECLDNGNLLITEFSVSRVQEVTREGKQVWVYDDLRNPYDADRLPNGNTLIADTFRDRVIEVDAAGKIVWSFAKNIRPFDVDRLPNGNTLIADALNDRVIETDADGQIVWSADSMPNVHDADRLPNGNTLITVRSLNKVVEIDRAGKKVWELTGLNSPSDADRLPNGHTLVAEHSMVREFDRGGKEVWKKTMQWAVEVNRY